LWSINLPYSAEGRARVEAIVGSLYDSFTGGVARGRNLPPARVREIAKGRVWAGETALGLGLVDELGGLHAALAAVRRELELPADAELRVELLPDDGGPLKALWRRLRPSAAGLELALSSLEQLQATLGTAVSLPLTLR
jgi:protease-4